MGEIADMLLDGILDMDSGEYIGDENQELFGSKSPGFPRKRGDQRGMLVSDKWEKVPCPQCGKKVKKIGLPQHIRAAHSRVATVREK